MFILNIYKIQRSIQKNIKISFNIIAQDSPFLFWTM